jgi:CHAT domain-containing protein
LLTASEISELSLDADWVLLLACNTAAADGTPEAEPLSGLASSFLFAGARALLVSHWSVDAKATARFIELAFGDGNGPTRSDQLHAARKKIRSESSEAGISYSHPAFWASFVLIGDAR